MSLKAIGELDLVRVWVNPDHTLGTVFHLLIGFNLPAIPVRDGAQLVGVLSANDLLGQPHDALAETFMREPVLVVDAQDSVRNVAVQMAKYAMNYALVEQDGLFLGIVTSAQLLQEMARSWDPLTGLSWSDQLREWGIDMLRAGREITIIFIDIDNFGRYNKVHGHIVGDRILKIFANVLSQSTDEELDVLVRYGGDEFAIGTTRSRTDAERLASILEARLSSVSTNEPNDFVSASIGMFGGRRTQERENTHYAATVDALINLASKDCLSKKRPQEDRVRTGSESVVLRLVSASVHGNLATVKVASPTQEVTRSRSFAQPEEQFASIAEAVLEAAAELATGRKARLGEIAIAEPRPGVEVMQVRLQSANGGSGSLGQCEIAADVHQATGVATLRAFLAME